MPDGPGGFRLGSTCPAVLRILLERSDFRLRGLHLLWPAFQCRSASLRRLFYEVLQPQSFLWFGLLRVRSPLLAESFLFSFPPGTKMFQFPGLLSRGLCIHPRMAAHCRCRVPPFGYPRILALLPLPVAFRRLMRPSSAASGQAFTVRPY